MKSLLFRFCLSFSLLLLVGSLMAQSPVGIWKTIDDETQQAKSHVQIYRVGNKLFGKVIKLIRQPGEDPDPVCEECDEDDPRYMKKVKGMVILKNLVREDEGEDDAWENGEILDPKNGKVYDCDIELVEANKLKIRGYIGITLFGRTQYWYRVQ